MSEATSQGAQRPDMRQQMPETAKWVEARRTEYGAAHVNACIRRALKGEPGYFYAMEAGFVLGTPFPATHPVAADQEFAVMMGCTFAAFMVTPVPALATSGGATDGAH